MRIGKTQLIAGLSAREAREIVRLYSTKETTAEYGSERLGIPLETMRNTLERLQAEGYLDKDVDSDGNHWYLTTVKGNALAQASLAKPIKRATAERHLASVICRTETYNADDSKLLSIEFVYVFGSYLDEESHELGDLDLAIQILRRHPPEQHNILRQRMVKESGRTFSSFIEELFGPLAS